MAQYFWIDGAWLVVKQHSGHGIVVGFLGFTLFFPHCFPRRLDLVNIAGMQLVPINALMCLIVIIIGGGEYKMTGNSDIEIDTD